MTEDQGLEYLNEVDESLARNQLVIDEAIETVLDHQVSDYPILIWQRTSILEVGVILISNANPGNWELRISTLEEFSGKNMIRPDRIADFRNVYRDARQQYCLFVVTDSGASFAFRPRS